MKKITQYMLMAGSLLAATTGATMATEAEDKKPSASSSACETPTPTITQIPVKVPQAVQEVIMVQSRERKPVDKKALAGTLNQTKDAMRADGGVLYISLGAAIIIILLLIIIL